jgi:N-acetylglucosamine repressor
MIDTSNLNNFRNINRQMVLNLIRDNSIISAPDLANYTGLRPSTILYILKDLTQKNMIKSMGKGSSTERGGKRPVLWKLNDSAAFLIGLDIEIGEISAVILNLGGDTIAQQTIKIEPSINIAGLVENINILIDEIIKKAGIESSKILGMGIAFAGVVNRETGTIVIGDIFPNMNISFLSELSKHFTFPIIMENNANACAIGTKWLGVARGKRNFMTILIELDYDVSGMGIGIVINEELYHGSSYCAGELNVHLPKLRDMLENIRHRFHEGSVLSEYISIPEKIDIQLMINAAKQGDEIALTFFSIFGNLVGKSISSSVALLNPDTIIITGDISSLGEIIINPIRNVIEMEVLSLTNSNLEIVCSKHGHYFVANGAAALVLDDFFKLPSINKKKIVDVMEY